MGKIWTQKPPVGSQIDWSHPLSKGLVGCWLMNEGGGNRITNLVYRDFGIFNQNTKFLPFRKNSIYCNTSTNDGITIQDQNYQRFNDFTLHVDFYAVSGGIAINDRLFEKEYNNVAGEPYVSWGFEWRSSTQIKFIVARSVSVANNELTISSSVLSDKQVSVTGTYNSSVGYIGYVNGVYNASDYTKTGAILYSSSATSRIDIASLNGASNSVTTYFTHAFLWNRALSPQEISSLYQAPYQFIQRPSHNSTLFTIDPEPAVTIQRMLMGMGV